MDRALAPAPYHRARGRSPPAIVEHAYIEPEAGYAERVRGEGGSDRIRIFACTQTPYMDREEVARVLQLREDQVHIVPSAIGGGFGGKLDIAIQPLLAVAAWKLEPSGARASTRGPSPCCPPPSGIPGRMRARFACDAQGRLLAADFLRRLQHRRLRVLGQHGGQPRADPRVAARTSCPTCAR